MIKRHPVSRSGRRVCHLRATNFFGGPEKQILQHCLHLDRGRWDPVLATFRDGDRPAELLERARDEGVETFEIVPRFAFDPRTVRGLRAELEAHRIEILVTHGYKSDVVGYLATRGGPVRQIACMRGFTGEDLRVRLYERVDRRVLRQIPMVVCVSRATAEQMRQSGIDPEALEVIHNAIHFVDSVERTDLRGELGISRQAELVLAVGRLSPEKGHIDLILAAAELVRSRPQLHIAILGDGKQRPELLRRAAELGIESRIHLPGFRTDVLPCLAAANLVVNPSRTEGLPNVLLEAFVVGVPVVATDVGGVAELVEPDRSGILVPSRDVDALAGAIGRALSNPVASANMAIRARERVQSMFTFEGQARRWMDVYDRLVDRGASRAAAGIAVGLAGASGRR